MFVETPSAPILSGRNRKARGWRRMRSDTHTRVMLRQAHGAPERVLLALSEDEFPAETLTRAGGLSLGLDAELHTLRVVPRLARQSGVSQVGNPTEAFMVFQRTLASARATVTWLAEGLGQRVPVSRLKLRSGPFLEQVALCAQELGASLIVISGRDANAGMLATALARCAATPVLVARPHAGANSIMAAIDFTRRDFAVLRRAGELGRRLAAPLLAMHNISPQTGYVSSGMGAPLVCVADDALKATRRSYLLEAAKLLALQLEPVVSIERDPARAILDAARAHDVDLIVLGTPPRSWFGRILNGSVAAAVVERAQRSVLVVPLTAQRRFAVSQLPLS